MVYSEEIPANMAGSLCKKLIKALPDYFGLPQANQQYVKGVRSCVNLAARTCEEYIGLASINFPYPNNAHIYWMAVMPLFQSRGIGRQLIEKACEFAHQRGATTMTVETLAPLHGDKNYLKTYDFYVANGFLPLFNLKPEKYEWQMVYLLKRL